MNDRQLEAVATRIESLCERLKILARRVRQRRRSALEAARRDPGARRLVLPSMVDRRRWSSADQGRLRELYSDTPTAEISHLLGRSVHQIYGQANRLGLSKSPAYLASFHACRLRRGGDVGSATRFSKGQIPHNKGVEGWDAGGRSYETRFKPGQRNWKKVDVGAERINANGYRDRKVADTGYPPTDWRPVHLLLWEEHHGPVPSGFVVRFKDGDKARVAIENLELIARADLAVHNRHGYPPELTQTIRAHRRLQRAIAAAEEP